IRKGLTPNAYDNFARLGQERGLDAGELPGDVVLVRNRIADRKVFVPELRGDGPGRRLSTAAQCGGGEQDRRGDLDKEQQRWSGGPGAYAGKTFGDVSHCGSWRLDDGSTTGPV